MSKPVTPHLIHSLNSSANLSRKRTASLILIIFITALSFRAAAWYYWRTEAPIVQTTVATNYKVFARLLATEGLSGFFNHHSEMSTPDLLGHPPGYPLLLAVVYKTFGESDTIVQFAQIVADAMAAILIFLIVSELLNSTIAFIAGILAAASPQFAWNSMLLLPDTLAVPPLLLAIYLLIRARTSSRLYLLFAAGVSIGISCLFRPNALLFAPFLFLVIATLGSRLQIKRPLIGAVLLLAGTLITIGPFTIRNAIVFGRFVPLSIGGGQTILEGIADYDRERRFGFPDNDVDIARMEAERFNRPDYAETLFGPDGIERDQYRLRQGTKVIVSHPVWFATVMIRRAASMLRMERVPLVFGEASRPVAYPLVLRLVQRIFVTAIILPLSLAGVAVLVYARRWFVLASLLVIPLYYFIFQSALHTEYRYVLALYPSLFALAAIAIYLIAKTSLNLMRKAM